MSSNQKDNNNVFFKAFPKVFSSTSLEFLLVAEGYNIFRVYVYQSVVYSINDSTGATVFKGASSCGTCPNSSKMTS